MRAFEYFKPESVDEAIKLLAHYGASATVMAGGTDVMVGLNRRELSPENLLDIGELPGLRYIKEDDGTIRIGALTTQADIASSELLAREVRALSLAAGSCAGPQVRNLGTIGGNLGTAASAGDLILGLAPFDAKIKLLGPRGERFVSLEDFLLGTGRTNRAPDELIVEVIVNLWPGLTGSGFQKLGRRKAMTISIASAAASVVLSSDGGTFEDVVVALGSAGPTVMRARRFEEALKGQPAIAEEIEKHRFLAGEEALLGGRSPATDWYRREMASVLAGRAVEDAVAHATGRDISEVRAQRRKKGKGIAGVIYSSTVPAAPNPCGANIHMREDGSVLLQMGSTDIGQGSDTVLSQLAAEALGVPYGHVTIVSADTGTTPYDFGTVSSRQTYAGGNAILQAAAEVKAVLLEAASAMLEVPQERLVIGEGMIRDKEVPEKAVPIAAAAGFSYFALRKAPLGQACFYPVNTPPDHNLQGQPIASFYYHATAAEVEVDTETGVVDVLRLNAVVDCGKAINPMLVEGQVDGGALQALGWALREDSHPGLVRIDEGTEFDPDLVSTSLEHYAMATALDMPDIQSGYVEIPEQGGPFGAKAAGEITAVSGAPAILNAIHDAIGIRLYELPATPERVLRALVKGRDQPGVGKMGV